MKPAQFLPFFVLDYERSTQISTMNSSLTEHLRSVHGCLSAPKPSRALTDALRVAFLKRRGSDRLEIPLLLLLLLLSLM